MTTTEIDLDRLLRPRLVVARFGEMDLARWWNTRGQLGRLGLEETHKIRRGDDGYRIPTPAEDDWERLRNGIDPKPGDAHRLYSETLSGFWQPQPAHTLFETKTFKAGLATHGREVTGGDMVVQFHLADEGMAFESLATELRARSQQERKHVFWAVGLNDAIDREIVELFRSKEILARKERETKGEDTPALMAEERLRQRRHQDELRRLFRAACLAGRVYFRGNDRGPGDKAVDVGKAAAEILGQVLPDIFERFQEAGAKANDVRRGTDAIFAAANLQGLPAVFTDLSLLRDEKGKVVFRVESGPLKEVLDRVEERANYGDTASGRYLADEFAKEPFGWDFDVVRLLVLCLMRADKVEATSKGLTLDSVTGVVARDNFTNNLFRQASFRPRKGIEFEELVKAAEAFRDTFGSEVRELNPSAIANELRDEIARNEDTVASALSTHRGLPAIEQHARAIELEYARRFDDAQQACVDAYAAALKQLASVPGWHEMTEQTHQEIAAPLVAGQRPLARTAPISLLRSERDACEARLRTAIRRIHEIIEGERLASVEVQSYFAGGVETEEQLDAALSGLREECARLIGAGKKVVLS